MMGTTLVFTYTKHYYPKVRFPSPDWIQNDFQNQKTKKLGFFHKNMSIGP